MAPIPVDNNLNANTDLTPKKDSTYWTKANIALTTVFGLVFLGIALAALIFFLHRRKQKKKLDNRKSDKAGLLADEDKTHMFSRHRASSVTLYVDHEADARNKRSSTDTMHLIPLQITPVDEARDPIGDNTESAGTGVSSASRLSNATLSTLMLSTISPSGDEGDLGMRPSGRARSTSTASQRARYYETTPTNVEMPPIPKIVRIPSDPNERPHTVQSD
jgi:cbb3-type cytochrome oxidase subunit 3